jgi:hypothetical protein
MCVCVYVCMYVCMYVYKRTVTILCLTRTFSNQFSHSGEGSSIFNPCPEAYTIKL